MRWCRRSNILSVLMTGVRIRIGMDFYFVKGLVMATANPLTDLFTNDVE